MSFKPLNTTIRTILNTKLSLATNKIHVGCGRNKRQSFFSSSFIYLIFFFFYGASNSAFMEALQLGCLKAKAKDVGSISAWVYYIEDSAIKEWGSG
jgi:hypothetical protein